MAIDKIDKTAAPDPTGATANKFKRSVGKEEDQKDAFMKVFLKQLQMQNPMKPYDSSAMLQQMSQLTNLKATEELEKTIKNMNANMLQNQALEASQLVGRKVELASEQAPLIQGEGLRGSVLLRQPATGITITIKDPQGKEVATIQKGPSGVGVVDFEWDGKIPDGIDENGKEKFKELDPGLYKMTAMAAKADGTKFQEVTLGAFKVNSVALGPEGAIFNIDGWGGKKLSDIIKIL